MAHRNRPPKRVLLRWSDDLDKGVLLAVQYACAEAGIKLPWARVAEIMGPKFTEGAITQHLAKLRGIMEKSGIPVPPSLRRGMVSRTPSKVYANPDNKHSFDAVTPMHAGTPRVPDVYKSIYDKSERTEEDTPLKPKARARARARGKGKGRRMSDEDDEDEPVPELYDSDEDVYTAPKKRRRTTKTAGPEGELAANLPSTPPSQVIKAEGAGQSSATALTASSVSRLGSPGPSRRTRGIKRDYSIMAAIPSESGDDAENNAENDAENDAENEETGSDDAGDHTDVASSSEGETEIYVGDAGDAEVDENGATAGDFVTADDDMNDVAAADHWTHPSQVADFPYGQIQMSHLVPNNSLFIDHNGRSVTHLANHPGVLAAGGLGALLSNGYPMNAEHVRFNTAGMNGFAPDGGPFGGVQFAYPNTYPNTYSNPYANAHLLNPFPQAYPTTGLTPSMSTDSSFPSTRNNSVATGMTAASLASHPGHEGVLEGLVGDHASNWQQIQSTDVIREADMNDSMPSGEIVWADGYDDYPADDGEGN